MTGPHTQGRVPDSVVLRNTIEVLNKADWGQGWWDPGYDGEGRLDVATSKVCLESAMMFAMGWFNFDLSSNDEMDIENNLARGHSDLKSCPVYKTLHAYMVAEYGKDLNEEDDFDRREADWWDVDLLEFNDAEFMDKNTMLELLERAAEKAEAREAEAA